MKQLTRLTEITTFKILHIFALTKRFYAWIRSLVTWAKGICPWAKRLSVRVLPIGTYVLALVWLGGGCYLGYELYGVLRSPDNNTFGNARAILLTLAAWIGVPFLIWRTLLADRQTRINRETYYADLFTKAIESLGATRINENGAYVPVMETRIGAIFALERLAKQSRGDYGIIIETLATYIREQCGNPSFFVHEGPDPDEEGINVQEKETRLWAKYRAMRSWIEELQKNSSANRADVVVALTVLSRRREGRHWNAQYENEPQTSLSRVNLQGWKMVNDENALHDADLRLSDAYLEGASMSGFYVEDSPILGIQIRYEMTHSYVSPRSLVGTNLPGLTLRNAQFFPVLDCANLSYAHMDGAKCVNASFRSAILIGADFSNAILRDAKFGCANASTAKFDGADLSNTEFIATLLHRVSFVGADLSHNVFHGAQFNETHIEGALLIGADFTGAKGLEAVMFERAFGTNDTLLPSNVARPIHWMDETSAVEEWTKFRQERGLDARV